MASSAETVHEPEIGEGSTDSKYCNPCLFDEQEVGTVAFCVACIEYLCISCLKDHTKCKATRFHKILKGKNIPTNVRSFYLLEKTTACPNHPDKEIEYKCGDHDEYLCGVCIAKKHRKCELIEEISETLDENSDSEKNGIQCRENLQLLMVHKQLLKQRKEKSIGHLLKEHKEVNEVRENYFQQVVKIIQTLKEQSEKETDTIVKNEVEVLRKEIERINAEENEQQQYTDLLETALEHGNPKQVNVVLNDLSKTIHSDIQKINLNEKNTEDEVSVKFKPNADLLSTKLLGSVEIVKCEKPPNKDASFDSTSVQEHNLFDENTASDIEHIELNTQVSHYHVMDKLSQKSSELSTRKEIQNDDTVSSVVKEKESSNQQTHQVSPVQDNKSKSLMQSSEVLEAIHNVEEDNDDNISCIEGCVVLGDRRFVLIDSANDKIKVFDKGFSFLFSLKLNATPCAICQLDDSGVAVTYSDLKRIDRFIIYHDSVESNGGFATKLQCRSITRHGNCIAVLFADTVNDDDDSDSEREVTEYEIQIREAHNGKVIETIDLFRHFSGDEIEFDNANVLMSHGDTFYVGDEDQLWCFDDDGDLQWFYKSNKGNDISVIYGATIDNEGNVYVCGNDSNNIHQIRAGNFRNNRVIVPYIENPHCITFDSLSKRIIVGCDSNNVYVYAMQ